MTNISNQGGNNNKRPTKVIIPRARLMFANVWEAKTPLGGGNPKFSTGITIEKTEIEALKAIEAAVQAAGEEGRKIPGFQFDRHPLRDGDKEKPDDPAYKNCYFLNASSLIAPEIVDKKCEPILDRSKVYSGVYVTIAIIFFPYNKNGNRGVSASLGNIMWLEDPADAPLGSRSRAIDDFNGGVPNDTRYDMLF